MRSEEEQHKCAEASRVARPPHAPPHTPPADVVRRCGRRVVHTAIEGRRISPLARPSPSQAQGSLWSALSLSTLSRLDAAAAPREAPPPRPRARGSARRRRRRAATLLRSLRRAAAPQPRRPPAAATRPAGQRRWPAHSASLGLRRLTWPTAKVSLVASPPSARQRLRCAASLFSLSPASEQGCGA